MSEFDELVASPGVIMAGRFGPDGRVAKHKTTGLYIENPRFAGAMLGYRTDLCRSLARPRAGRRPRKRRRRLGIPGSLAEEVADHVDWHQIATLIRRGCPPRLALRIVL